MAKILIIGAGLSGATIARKFADDGHTINIIEKRNHIAGNVYDYIDENGIMIGKYGAHIFHTSHDDVWRFVNQFGKWKPYQHRVLSKVNDKLVPIPVNIDTVNIIFNENITTEDEMKRWLKSERGVYKQHPINSKEAAIKRVGSRLYKLMFENYTNKQWAIDPSELEASVLERIPVRTDYNDRYFSDTYEAMPTDGYTKFVENVLNHENINVLLDKDYFEMIIDGSLPGYEYIFYTGKIDTFFGDKHGKLQYRSLVFEHEVHNTESYQAAAVVNYPSTDVKYTRIVEHKKLYQQKNPKTLITKEYSTAFGEPYYPIPTRRNRDLYKKYQKDADNCKDICFVGRLANYKYFNMDQAIKNALDIYNNLKGELK